MKATIALMLALLPQPSRVVRHDGAFTLTAETRILVDRDSADAANVGKQLADRINRSTALGLAVVPSEATGVVHNTILLSTKNANATLGDEGYTLEASSDGVVIHATAGPGLFYGAQTLLQLLPPLVFSPAKVEEAVAWSVPAVRIEDKPRFRWRGLMLDVSRNFFNKDEIKNFIDLMAQHKMNTFHWHLTDDPGWRIEIKRYPKLVKIGAWWKEILYENNPKDSTARGPDGRYGGFYTQDDIREIVNYAKARYITIVPEIEMPGHSGSALAAYPEYTCTGNGPSQLYGTPDILPPGAVFCVGNEGSFHLIEGVLTELLDLFPSQYIHIGGDEVEKDFWQKCEKCQARMRREGLKNENELQSYFIRRIEKFLNAHHRNLIGWDEILEGGLAPNATVMSWRGIEGGIAAAKAGHDVVMTPLSHCYFDFYQAKTGEPKAPPQQFLPLSVVYSYEPIPLSLDGQQAKHVLGAQGNLWTERVPNYRHAQYMAYPRACAMAELTWSDPQHKNWADFRKRLDSQLLRLKAQGVNYRQPRPDDDAPGK